MRNSVRLTLILLVCVTHTRAQLPGQPASNSNVVPTLISYSGRAVDDAGKAITGIAGITFSIYKDQSSGSPLWFETQNVTTDARGNYTIQLGATMPEGLPSDLFTSGEAHWLGVRINGGEEQPRTFFLSVPYALKAADAQTLGGLPASAFMQAKTRTAAPTEMAGPSIAASSSKSHPVPANPPVTGLGISNFIPIWDSTSDIVNSILFQKTSRIGVNTASPLATLDVNGKALVRDSLILLPKSTDNTLAINGTNFTIDSTGRVSFISDQTFPGTGTITGVNAGTALTGGGNSGTIALNVDTTKVPLLSATNSFTGPQAFNNTATFNNTSFFDALMTMTTTGTFTAGSYNASVLNQVGGISNGTTAGLPNYDAFSSGIAVPMGANRPQFTGVAGYATSAAVSSPLGANDNAVALYGRALNQANNTAVWGANTNCDASSSLTGHWMICFENDLNGSSDSHPQMFVGIMNTGILTNTFTMPAAPSYTTGLCGPAGGGCAALVWHQHQLGAQFPVGEGFENGEVVGDAFRVPALCQAGGTCASATFALIGMNAGNAKVTQQFIDSNGDFNIVPNISAPYTGGSGNGIILNPNTGGKFQITKRVFSQLPTCAAASEGSMLPVSDSNTITWGAAIVGGGTNHVLAYCDGTNWTVAAK